MYQSARGNAIVKVSQKKDRTKIKILFKGACLRYDAVDEILVASPFEGGPNCWNSADWLVILSPFCIFAIAILYFIWLPRHIDGHTVRTIKKIWKTQDAKYDAEDK